MAHWARQLGVTIGRGVYQAMLAQTATMDAIRQDAELEAQVRYLSTTSALIELRCEPSFDACWFQGG